MTDESIHNSYLRYIDRTRETLKNLPSPRERIYSLMTHHRDLIELSGRAICLECSSEMKSEDIKEWTDLNTTGICPECGIDKLIPIIDRETLEKTESP
jgi:hypothetical protein